MGMLLLEHVNVNVQAWEPAQRFYEALGCERAGQKCHMNCGTGRSGLTANSDSESTGRHTQFHLPSQQPTQQWRGTVTVAYTKEGLISVRDRLKSFAVACPDEVHLHEQVILVALVGVQLIRSSGTHGAGRGLLGQISPSPGDRDRGKSVVGAFVQA